LKNLRSLSINLRWCDQVTDEWLESLGKVLPESLENLELWVMECSRLTDAGFQHMMENMGRCNRLNNVKIYASGTSLSDNHG